MLMNNAIAVRHFGKCLTACGECMFAYQKTARFFAQIASGLEESGVKELTQLGATRVKPVLRGLYFVADQAALYRINYCSRLITRVLAPLLTFDCPNEQALYDAARAFPWTELLALTTTFAIFANVTKSQIHHSEYAGLRVKDAIVDQFREACGDRPNVDPMSPDVWINLYIYKNNATLSFDTSGGSLHRRGYRQAAGEAPIQETLAAAMIQLSGWHGERPLYDPMCGSGTLLIEALMQVCQIPAAYLRPRFGFERLPDFHAEVWQAVKQQCDSQIHSLPQGLIQGSDQARAAIEMAYKNCQMLPRGEKIALVTRRFQDIPDLRDTVIVCNPPYGQRMNTARQAATLLEEFGAFLKTRCQGSSAYLYLGQETLLRHLALWPAWKKPLNNGGLPGYLAKYVIT